MDEQAERAALEASMRQLVPRAAAGDAAAATQLFQALISRSQRQVLAALNVLRPAASAELWQRIVEFLGTNRWSGGRLALPLASELPRQRLRRQLHSLLTLHWDPAADAARHRALVSALRHPAIWVRVTAADLLGEREEGEALEPLVRALEDPAPVVRIHAARALGRLGQPAAVEPLVRALRHRHDALTGAAEEAFVHLGPAALPGLIEASRSEDEWVRQHAAHALGKIHDPRAIPPLVDLLDDSVPAVRWAAVQALQRYGTSALEPVVHSLVTRSVTLGLADAAGHLLRQVKDPRLAALLRPLAEHLGESYAPVSVPPAAGEALSALRAYQQTDPSAPPPSR